MKKTYIRPTMVCITCETEQILAASNKLGFRNNLGDDTDIYADTNEEAL